MERKIVDRVTLINKLNSMSYKEISEAQMRYIFMELGRTIKIEEANNEESEIIHELD